MAMSLEKCKGENRNDFGKRFWKIEKRKREYNSMPPFSWENEVILVFLKKKKKGGGRRELGDELVLELVLEKVVNLVWGILC